MTLNAFAVRKAFERCDGESLRSVLMLSHASSETALHIWLRQKNGAAPAAHSTIRDTQSPLIALVLTSPPRRQDLRDARACIASAHPAEARQCQQRSRPSASPGQPPCYCSHEIKVG